MLAQVSPCVTVETSNAIANNTGTATANRARASDVFNPDDIVADPGLRKQIEEYATLGIRDEVSDFFLLYQYDCDHDMCFL